MAVFKDLLGTLVLLLALSSTSVYSLEPFRIESPKVTDWGNWGDLEICPTGTFVFGYRQKVEPYQTVLSDDCALNSIELLCISPGKSRAPSAALTRSKHTGLLSKAFATVISKEGHRGDWGPVTECPEPEFAVGFNLRSEKDQGWFADDTAANDFRMICSGGGVIDAGNGTPYGDWSDDLRCPRGTYVCGIQTQVEDEQGEYMFGSYWSKVVLLTLTITKAKAPLTAFHNDFWFKINCRCG